MSILLHNGRVSGPVFKNERGTEMTTLTCIDCGGSFAVRLKMAAKIARCDGCKVWTMPGSPTGFNVAVAQLAPVVEEIIEKKDRQLRHEYHLTPGEESGAVDRIASDAAQTLGKTLEAVVRRIYDIRAGKAKVVNTEFADAILLAGGRMIEDEDIKTFPATIAGAVSMIEIELEEAGLTFTPEEIQQAARARLKQAAEEVLALDRAA